ncbi:TetR/AcrR family transcriptional regulator [Thermocatellispora tengchongensis]|uniref:TetR/AcrR family transcriptional regulator n=1 Tax=Thermocatellispora tengchongensis TaxID=1073253 RepID=UPI003637A508
MDGSTRERILRAAQELFAQHGYQQTSVRAIAERLGLTKTAVLYHFGTKAEILSALATPILDDLAAAVTPDPDPGSGSGDPEVVRWRTMERVLDTWIRHRHALRIMLRDITLFTKAPAYTRFVMLMSRANELVAGPAPSFADRVRAAQAVAMLSDPVIVLADAPEEDLRREVLAGARRLFAAEPPTATGTQGARRGGAADGPRP